ncbi:MAG: hypothetical protein J2P46_11975 [Zavarzinella sp.]|nr:hypothetical protein [Zavarzinella sp.]
MFRALCVGLLVAAPALAESKDEFVLRRTLESLQGNWGVTNMAVAGMPASPDSLRGMGYRFEEDRMIQTQQPEESARLNIDVSGPIPKVDFTDRHGVNMVGIMQRVGDRVFICLVEAGNEPPTSFVSSTDNKAVLIELSRPRP